MKINHLGTFTIIGVALSITVACGGSPTKPTAVNPAFGDGASAGSAVNVTNPRPVGALVVCANQPDAVVDENGETVPAPVVMCDAPAPPEPTADVVISDTPTGDDLQSARSR